MISRRLASTSAAWGVVAILLVACGTAESARPAPDFEHPDLDGNLVRLSELRGRTVVIDFWATWCAPCVLQPGELNAVWRAHRETGDLQVLGIEVGGASPREVRDWAAQNDSAAEYPILTGAEEALARRFGVLGYPALAIVAPDGTIASLHLGVATAEEIEEILAPHLAAAGAAAGASGS